jgi:A/G-specific adenine glycosylase
MTRKSLVAVAHDCSWRQLFRRRLLAWYRKTARDLPWRRTRDPYAIWVSEVMLQQTQVATVKSYFERFLLEFPDVVALARADEGRVLRRWEGLGYYRRARQLHQAARIIVKEHAGQFPRDAQTLRALPGIGRYTAGAILSIAFDARQPILEANTQRLLSRLLAYDQDIGRADGQRVLWTFAESLLPRKGAGTLNQALMELGGEVCTPREPDCDGCPVAAQCAARQQGRQQEIPLPKKSLCYKDVHEVAVVVRRRGRILLRQCAAGERWAGLWDFPRFAMPAQPMSHSPSEIETRVRDLTGLTIELQDRLTRIKHGVTRYRITLDCYQSRARSGRRRGGAKRLPWVRPDELEDYPLSVTGRQISRLLRGD